jgi:1,2-diacylglycerol 3-beta-galactosyltransferase
VLERLSRPFILKELKKLIKERNPDLVVSVHPMVNHLTARALKELRRRTPFLVVITDPVTLHRAWIAKDVDQYFVATKEAAQNCEHYGMISKKIKMLGMPIDPKFAKRDFEKAQARFDDLLDPEYFTVMLMGGGEGAGNMYKIIKAIVKSGLKVQLIVVAGRNLRLEKKIRAMAETSPHPIVVFGFTDKVAELMSESDLLITKAGPGSIAEGLAMNLPMIITAWLPGQEEGNVEFVVREGLGRVSEDPSEVVNIIESLMDSPEFEKMKRNIKRVRKPSAALEIGREIVKWL